MKIVTIITDHGLIRGMHNIKAGIVEYTWCGVREYAPASSIVPALLTRQAF